MECVRKSCENKAPQKIIVPWPLHGYLVRAQRARDTHAVSMEHRFFEGLFSHGILARIPWVSPYSN